ncbi:related to CDC14 - dual specificity phosphatase [Ustilago trichophora]|uniref:protein-tyrosine-phosphatase n=1 Tax=Ustilago trichophora TaxID=86804 RepID=A0A5C3EMG8_9BASI|nr:related to CDC14 - dual specificity phosphatase [Ustilago trichophora]
MASTSAFVIAERQEHIIAPDDSDFLDSDAESTTHPEDHLIESAVLEDLQSTPHRSSTRSAAATTPKLWPAHPLIRIHKRLWFTWFNGDLPSEDDLNKHNGQAAARKNFNNDEIKKYVDPSETNPARLHWFNIDHDLVYLSFWFDWGPLNVGMFYRFCLHVHHMLTDPDMQDATLVLYTTDAPAQKANAALLATLYAMIIGKVTPADAFYPISEVEFKPFRDAGYGRADYNLSIQDILYGVHRAINEGLLDLTTFNLDEYEKYEQVSNGDWNWITPNFIAFASPNDRNYVEALRVGGGRLPSSYSFRAPGEDKLFGKTIRYFKDRGVKLVVRLNNPLYDREAFLNAGIDHSDMYFDDGSNPTDEILTEFIAKADKVIAEDGVVAVHCKAGLGRTGVLIGAYLVWKHGFSAGEAIGFMRFMRPGCVVGPQQHFMYQNFVEWIKWGVRDHAVKEAKQMIAEERAKIEAAQAAAASAAVAVAAPVRASIKRRAAGSDAAKGTAADDSFEAELQAHADQADDQSLDSDDGKHAQVSKLVRRNDSDDDELEQQRPRQKQKSDVVAAYSDINASGPVTPRAQRGLSHAVPASAAPNVKPAPCVGQPRKSPSPSRKRPAIQAPATVARLELTSRRYPTATRSFNTHLMLSSQSVHVDATASTEAAEDDVDSNSASFSQDEKVRGSVAAPDAGMANGGVLVESRINVVNGSTTPRVSPKAAMVGNLTPSPVARVRGYERARSNTVGSATVVATPVRRSSRKDASPSAKQQEVFRASPTVRDRYGLRDSSQSPPPLAQTPSLPRANGGVVPSRQASPVKVVAPQMMAKMSDAEVLGVIDCIPQPQQQQQQQHGQISAKVKPSPAKLPPKEEGLVMVDENVPSSQPAAVVQVHRAPLTVTSAGGAKVLRSVRSKTTLNPNSTSTSASTSGRVATVRKPISTTRTVASTTVRSVSARQPASTTAPTKATVALRAQKSAADLRAKTPTSTHASAGSRNVSNSSTTATVTSRPGSRLTAPTAASAARAAAAAAATAKRSTTAVTTAGNGAGIAGGRVGGIRKVSGLQKQATTTRRRRSSTGEVGVDVA